MDNLHDFATQAASVLDAGCSEPTIEQAQAAWDQFNHALLAALSAPENEVDGVAYGLLGPVSADEFTARGAG